MITITNVSTDDLFKGTFQQKILVVDKKLDGHYCSIIHRQETQKFKRSHTTLFVFLKISQVFL
jgi:cytochrome c1